MDTFLIDIVKLFIISFLISVHSLIIGNFIYSKISPIGEIKLDQSKNIFLALFIISNFLVLVNFFLPIGKLLTTIFFITPFLLCFFIHKNISIKIANYSAKFAIFSIFLIAYDNINRPDAGLYHYPFMKILSEHKIIIGSANLHFRFGHTSILQYLSAGYNNYLFNEKGMLIPIALIFYATVKYFYDKIKFYRNKNNLLFLFSFLILFQILFDMNRYSGFGNDVPAHLAVFVAAFYFLEKEFLGYKEFFYLSCITIFAFQIKTTMLIIFLLPLYILIINTKYIKNKTNLFILAIVLLWFLKNILISGCLMFPISATCPQKIFWSTSKIYNVNSAQRVSVENEAWAKAWPNRTNSQMSYDQYLKDGWIMSWMGSHGKLVVLKKISPLLIVFFVLLFFKKKNKINSQYKSKLFKKIFTLHILGIIGTLAWIIKFPTYRYGASYVIIYLASLITLFNLKTSFDNKTTKKFINLIVILFSIILLKYVSKYDDEKYFFPQINSFSSKAERNNDTMYFRKVFLEDKFAYYTTDEKNLCMFLPSPCTNIPTDTSLKHKKVMNYAIFYLSSE